MLSLKPFQTRTPGFADLLPYAALIDDGLVLTKDGSLISGFFYGGPDVASMTAEEKDYRTGRLNSALAGRGSGWVYHFDAVRMVAADYPAPEISHFPDAVSRLIDNERRELFLREGAHFGTEHALLVMCTPPLRRQSSIADWIYDDDRIAEAVPVSERHIEFFKQGLAEIEDRIGDLLRLRRMSNFMLRDRHGRPQMQDELVNYLHFCVTGQLTGPTIPPCAIYLDAFIGGQELWTGDTPKIGAKFIPCVGIEGLPSTSWPFMTDVHDRVPVPHRFFTRFIALDQHVALSQLRGYRRRWGQFKRSFFSQVFRTPSDYVNEDAALMERQTESAITDANSSLVSFGEYTATLVLMGEDRAELAAGARVSSARLAARDLPAGSRRSTRSRPGWAAFLATSMPMCAGRCCKASIWPISSHPRPNMPAGPAIRAHSSHRPHLRSCMPRPREQRPSG